jgi:hypothetical protein
MMSNLFGPLPMIETQTDALSLDIERLLRLPPGAVLRAVRPDASELSSWATVATFVRGWNRVSSEERARGEGYTVHFAIADLYPAGQLVGWLTGEGHATHLIISTEGIYYEIDDVPPVPLDVGQTYDISCKTDVLVRASD